MSALLITNANIYLERGRFAEAMLVEGGLVRAVGTLAALEAAAPDGAVRFDAEGRTIVPGMNDSHCHLMMTGESLEEVQLAGVRSIAEMQTRIIDFIRANNCPEDAVLHGIGWNQDFFAEHRLPCASDLDAVSGGRALILERTCGHILVANTAAMTRAGITAETLSPAGGAFDLDEAGRPTGIFRENACALVKSILPAADRAVRARRLELAVRHALEQGVTSVHSMDIGGANWRETLDIYREFLEAHPVLRVNHQVNFMTPELLDDFLASGLRTGDVVGSVMNRVGPLKLFADGSLGARTAFMRAPYADDALTTGIATLTPEELGVLVGRAVRAGMQTTIHAIGDGAIERVIDAYEPFTRPGENPRRLGIVHVQITDDGLLSRMASRRILAQVQPIFLQYDMTVVDARVGSELAATSYAFRTMEALGIPVSYGTDSPVEDLNPWANIASAVTRTSFANSKVRFHPEECVDVATAVDAYTTGSAYASFEERTKGRLLPGFAADFAMLSENPFTCAPEALANVRALRTWVAGETVWSAEEGFSF